MTTFKPTFFCQNCGKQNDWKGYSYENKYCNNACQAEARKKKRTEEWLSSGTINSGKNSPAKVGYNTTINNSQVDNCLFGAIGGSSCTNSVNMNEPFSAKYSASPIPDWIKGETGYIAQTRGYNCGICGISEWQGQKLVLETDFVDGNKANTSEQNLRLLCPNCKSQRKKQLTSK